MQLDQLLEEIITKIEENDDKWIKPFNSSLPFNKKSNTFYNGFNVINLWFISEKHGYKNNGYLTYNQVKELGGNVLQGEKAHDVFYFKMLNIKDEETEELKSIPLLKTYKVFNVDQTSLKQEEEEIKEEKADIEEFIKNTNVEIRNSGKGAFYVPSEDFIGIPLKKDFLNLDFYYATLFHELGHSTGHETRLNRDLSGSFGSDSYAKEELIAETTRVFLQAFFGIDSDEMKLQNAAYLKSWLKKENPKTLWKIFSEAQKAFDLLIGATKSY